MHVEVKGGDLPGLKALMQRMAESNRNVLVGVPAGEFEEGGHKRDDKAAHRFNASRERVAMKAARRKAGATAERLFRAFTLADDSEFEQGPIAQAMRRNVREAKANARIGRVRRDTGQPIPMAMIAAVHEFGQPELGIPERSFLRGGIRRGREKFSQLNVASLRAVVLGSMTIEQSLERLGVVATGEVKREFTAGTFEPNKPATKERKGSSRPLIDTGSLRQSITYVLEGKESAKARVIR